MTGEKRWETRYRRPETGDGRKDTGDQRRDTGDKRWEARDRREIPFLASLAILYQDNLKKRMI